MERMELRWSTPEQPMVEIWVIAGAEQTRIASFHPEYITMSTIQTAWLNLLFDTGGKVPRDEVGVPAANQKRMGL